MPWLQRARHGLVVSAGMFDNLSRGLDKAWDMVRKDGKLTADNIKGPMREIRRALLEADVRQRTFPPHTCITVHASMPCMDIAEDEHHSCRDSVNSSLAQGH